MSPRPCAAPRSPRHALGKIAAAALSPFGCPPRHHFDRHSSAPEESAMQYAVLIYETPGMLDGLDDAQLEQITAEYMTLRADPSCVDGAKLAPAEAATTVRVADGDALVTDGPFAST